MKFEINDIVFTITDCLNVYIWKIKGPEVDSRLVVTLIGRSENAPKLVGETYGEYVQVFPDHVLLSFKDLLEEFNKKFSEKLKEINSIIDIHKTK